MGCSVSVAGEVSERSHSTCRPCWKNDWVEIIEKLSRGKIEYISFFVAANPESCTTDLVKSKVQSFKLELENTVFLHRCRICQLYELDFVNQVENKYVHLKIYVLQRFECKTLSEYAMVCSLTLERPLLEEAQCYSHQCLQTSSYLTAFPI